MMRRRILEGESDIDYSNQYLTLTCTSDVQRIYYDGGLYSGKIQFWADQGNPCLTSVSYSTDNGRTWNTYIYDSSSAQTLFTVYTNYGDKVLLKGIATAYYYIEDPTDQYIEHCSFFYGEGTFDLSGNIMSLLYGDNFRGQTVLTQDYAFSALFAKNYMPNEVLTLTSIENLVMPATSLSEGCYRALFAGSSGDQHQSTKACQLPSTSMDRFCYAGMFAYNVNLVEAPELPATTLAEECYFEMFIGCTSLETAPELPATILSIGCYYYMFYNCTSLSYIKMLATDSSIWDSEYQHYSAPLFFTSWVHNVAASGTFVKSSNMTQLPLNNTSGIPSGWTVENETT